MYDRLSLTEALSRAQEDGPIYDGATLADLEAVFGRARLMELLGRLKTEIAQRLQGSAADRTRLGREAHALLSVSGALGFVELSRCCAAMERACLLGEDLATPLDAARAAGRSAIEVICAIEAAA